MNVRFELFVALMLITLLLNLCVVSITLGAIRDRLDTVIMLREKRSDA